MMSAVSNSLIQPLFSYVDRPEGPYRVSRMTRSAIRWTVLCEDLLDLSARTVSVLKTTVIGIASASLLFLVPRIIRTAQKIWLGRDPNGVEASFLDYIYVVGDTSKVAMLLLYKNPFVRFCANGANLFIYGRRMMILGEKYMNVSVRDQREDDQYLTLEIIRTITCVAYSAMRLLAVFLGYCLLEDAVMLALMTSKQLMHFGSFCYQEIFLPVSV